MLLEGRSRNINARRRKPECINIRRSARNVHEMCTSSVGNVIYHKFSHGAAFYMLNGKNVNVMLEFLLFLNKNICCDPLSDGSTVLMNSLGN